MTYLHSPQENLGLGGSLFDADALILDAIAPLCTNGIEQDKLPYFNEKVYPLVRRCVEFLMYELPEQPELSMLLWLAKLLGVPKSIESDLRSHFDLEDPEEVKLKSALKEGRGVQAANAGYRVARGTAFITPAGTHLENGDARLRRVAPLLDEQKLEIIKQLPLFSTLSDEEHQMLMQAMDLEKYLENEEVQKHGAPCAGMHIVIRGEGKVLVENEIGIVKPGDVFGDQEMLHGTPCIQTVEAFNGSITTLHLDSLALKALGLKKKLAAMRRKKVPRVQRDATLGPGSGEIVLGAELPTEEDVQMIIDAISKNENLREVLVLSGDQIEQICRQATRMSWKTGEVVFSKGDIGSGFYVVNDGVFELSSPAVLADSSLSMEARRLRTGDSFGEIALMYNAPRTATVECSRTGSCWVMQRQVFKETMQAKIEGRALEHAMLLSTVQLFKEGIAPECMASMCHALEERYYLSGETIVEQGATGDSFFIIFEGTCAVEQNGQEVATLTRGHHFGERALIEHEVRSATVKVVSERCTLLSLDRIAFDMLMGKGGAKPTITRNSLSGAKVGNIELAGKMASVLEKQGFRTEEEMQTKRRVTMDQLQRVGVLGRGAFGFVSLEQDIATGELYALKAMSKGHIKQEGLTNMVSNEKAVMQLLHSPFVVDLLNTFVDERNVYLLLTPCFGGELFDVYASHDEFFGSEMHARFYAACVAMGLDHLHSRRVVYRDLKLENCLLTLSGYCKLTDMGIAKVVVGKTYTVCGTADYFAPETLRQTGHNRAVDWWALGVMLFILMSGRSPFDAPDQMKIYRKIMKGFAKVNFPADCPELCINLIKALCQKKPEERLTMGSLGVQNYKDHSWYRDYHWNELVSHRIAAPYLPPGTEEEIIRKAATKNLENLPDIPYEDDGSGWDDIFAQGM